MMSDVAIPCPHCGYRLPGTPGRYDTCQKCKNKIIWTKGRPYKNLFDVPNEHHVIKPPPTRTQAPPVPSNEYEPEQSSLGVDASSLFNFVKTHEEQQKIDEAVEARNKRLTRKERWRHFKSYTSLFIKRSSKWLISGTVIFLATILILVSFYLAYKNLPVYAFFSDVFLKNWKNIIAIAVLFVVLVFLKGFWKRFLCATKRTVIGDDEDWKNEIYRHKKRYF